ncbi:lipopolysaccharide assembly protein LapB [Okeania sp. KiyG1]|uniref:tetratricopeptide repeat protein n=1 Tax=Okeania sp. KiyG1 TaxID=2720165 RepID=UPI00198DEF1F|nr:tetratricopeptide repeat protein [Okeania sp. KiyG1]GGA45695.1 hypothetical protein CYANOKiyG1_64640 [Okeania sp. KiyG1]
MEQKTSMFCHPTQEQNINFKQAKNFFSLGKIFAKKSEWKKAIAAYRRAIELAPDWKEARQSLTDAEHQFQEKTINTQQQIEPSKKLTRQAKHFFSLGKIFAKKSEWKEAIAAYRKAIELAPDWKEARQSLADVEHQLQEKTINTQQQIEPSKKLTIADYPLEKIATQIATASNAVIVNYNLADDYHANGDILVEKREKEEAIKAYKKAIEIQPELWEVHHKLGYLLQEKEELEEAVAFIRNQ